PRKIGPTDFSPVYAFFLKLALASSLAGLAGLYSFKVLTSRFGTTFLPVLVLTLLCGLASLLVFYAASRLLGLKEVDAYLKRFIKR
ncbi:MAG: hypothetical protein QHH44_06250, partial [Candidatus Saccharicenans sp.]|nr:hypothetical protein [Candidatus Saccharicenans sp.]